MPDAALGEPESPNAVARLRRLIVNPALRTRVLMPMAFDASVLVTNLVTGIIVARALGPSGRGEIAAILLVAQLCVWFFSGGATEAVAYRLARRREDGPRLLGTWLAVGVPLGILAIVAGEIALPVLFSAQTGDTIDLGRIYLAIVLVMMLQAVQWGMLLGAHDFLVYNAIRLFQPGLIAIGYLGCWALGVFSVEVALVINAAATGAAFLVAAGRLLQREGLARPSRQLMRETLSYGLKAHMGSVAGLVNARLDLLIVPAFLGAVSVGLYSVATNVTSIIITLTATIATIVMPVAARRDKQSPRTVIRTLQVVMLIGVAIALPLAAIANYALVLVYGSDFEGAATALRILLPGVVLDAAAMVLWSGLLAANRPLLSSVAAIPAAIITVAGLVLFLEEGGIDVAAIVSTIAYTVVFVISVFLYKRVANLEWREFLTPPSH
ncbi:MAG TPA: oligosaccharide flippase family protein [Solirubrobacterales bacterium]|nr:oligosaccharide flippase family protein [Solirubrobacterales bacterium]